MIISSHYPSTLGEINHKKCRERNYFPWTLKECFTWLYHLIWAWKAPIDWKSGVKMDWERKCLCNGFK